MSTVERPRPEWSGAVLSIVAAATIGAFALGSVTTDRASGAKVERPESRKAPGARTLAQHIDAVDAAIARNDLSGAIYGWRDAYGAALGARRWDAMADIGDVALRIDAVVGLRPGHPTGFRAEARQAYLRALFQARGARAQDGIERVARAFAALGDEEMAARARAIRVTP